MPSIRRLSILRTAHETRPPATRIDLIEMVTVYLHEDLLKVRFPFDAAGRAIGQMRLLVEVVVPGQIQQRLVLGSVEPA